MGRSRITNGIWTRNVNWEHAGEWRTDIFKSTLSDPRLRACRFVLDGGPTVLIPAEEMRRVLEGGADHYDGKIWGPFNINPRQKTLNGHAVSMEPNVA